MGSLLSRLFRRFRSSKRGVGEGPAVIDFAAIRAARFAEARADEAQPALLRVVLAAWRRAVGRSE
jgi:hypothetical protein